MTLRLLIAGGGTGGHLYPGIALAEAFLALVPGGQVLFVGTRLGLDATVVPKAGYALAFVRATKLKNASLGQRLLGLLRLLPALWDAFSVLRRFRPDLVVSVGGYSAGPTTVAAWLSRVPTVAVEPNAVPGLTNRWLGKLVRRVFVAQEAARRWFAAERVEVVGVPLRQAVVASLTRATATRASHDGLRVLIVGGSQGARFLNERVPATLRGVDGVEVLHQTGPSDVEAVTARYRDAGIAADVRAYLDDIASAYAWTDLAITRAGASTVAELAVSGTPAVLVPFPHAADDHQAANAQALANAGGAVMVRQEAWSDDTVRALLADLARDRSRLTAMRAGLATVARPNAAQDAMTRSLTLVRRAA